MTSILLLATLLFPTCPPGAADSLAAAPPSRIVTAAMIRDAGLQRPGEILRLLSGWFDATIDGFGGAEQGPWLAPPGREAWEVWLDGQRIDAGPPGARTMNWLPVALHDIAYVEATEGPVLCGGRRVEGVIHVHTRPFAGRPADGWRVRAGAWRGNESGDAGPLRFLGSEAANVDKLEGDVSGSAAWAGRRLRARATVVRRDHMPTDPALFRRIAAVAPAYPEIEGTAAELRVRVGAGRTFHDLSLRHGTFDDFVHLAPLGREVPIRQTHTAAGLVGRLGLAPAVGLVYRSGASTVDYGPPAGVGPGVDGRLTRLDARAGLERTAPAGRFSAGVSAGRVQLAGPGGALRAHDHAGVFADAGLRLTPVLRADVEAQAELGGDRALRPAWHAAAGAAWSPAAGHRLAARVSWSRRPPGETAELATWTRHGLGPLRDLGVDVRYEGQPGPGRTAAAVLAWSAHAADGVDLEAELQLRRVRGMLLARTTFAFDEEEQAVGGPVVFRSDASGKAAGMRVAVTVRPAWWTTLRAWVRAQRLLGGEAAFREAWAARPRLEGLAQWQLHAVDGFRMGLLLRARSGARWPALEAAAAASDGFIRARVPGWWTLDATASKHFWSGRVRGDLAVRNLLDRRYRYHPLGASFDLILTARVVVALGAR